MSQPGTPRLLSIQVGQPQTLGAEGARNPMDRRWTSGIFKQPVAGPVRLGWTNLELDAQADLSVHGGPDKAVCVYAADHYAYWRTNLRRADLPYGAFGENFTVAGMDETEVCIGDVFAVGQAQVQVSQPRQPCWKLARRWRVRDLAARVERMGYTGWYFRVLAEGIVAAGDRLRRLERPFPEWTVARANEVMRRRPADPGESRSLAACPLLSASWQQTLRRRSG